jgi:hypothetical protein
MTFKNYAVYAIAALLAFIALSLSLPVTAGILLLAAGPAVAARPVGFSGRGYMELANVLTGGALNINGAVTFGKDFPIGEGWVKMLIRFNNVIVIGTGAGAVTEGELLIIKNVLLKTDRGEILCNLPGRAIYKIAVYQTAQVSRKDAIAAASATYRVTLPIIFADMRMKRPMDTVLDTSRYQSISLQLTYGGLTDLFTAPGTATLAATIDIEVERTLGRLPGKAKPLFHINYDIRQPVDAFTLTNIDLERSADMNLKRLYVHSGTSGAAGVPWSGVNADTVQNIITVKDQNRFIQKERIHGMIQDGNKMDAFLEAVISGVEIFDFVRDGSIASALTTGNKSVFQYTWTNQAGVAANAIVTATGEQIRSLK